MDFSAALPTFVITLREGVEATLVVGIVLAYLSKAQQSRLNSWVYGGVVAGIGVSVLVGILFNQIFQRLDGVDQSYAPVIKPLLEAVFGILAIVLLSWMLVWMTRQAKALKSQVENVVDTTLKENASAGWGIFGLIFFAVLREGFETVLFITANFQQGIIPVLGAVGGLLTASAIGILLFRWGVKINLRQFFQVMGVLLLLIVAGLVISDLGHLDTAASRLAHLDQRFAGLCFYHDRFAQDSSCILGPIVWNTSQVLPSRRFPGIALHTLFGYTDKLYLVQAIGYLLFVFAVGGVYFQSLKAPSGSSSEKATQA